MKKFLLSLIILSFLVPILVPTDSVASGKARKVQFIIEALEIDLYKFCADVHFFPPSVSELEWLVSNENEFPNWKGPYIQKGRFPKDPWNNEFIYYYPAKYGSEHFDLYSMGKNGIDDHGLKDDITNWKDIDRDYYKSHFYLDLSSIIFLILLFDLPVLLIFYICFVLVRKYRKKANNNLH